MAHRPDALVASTLKAVSYRLSSTPTKDLPRIVGQAAASIWDCRELLQISPSVSARDGDSPVIVHKFKTQLSALLQDRSVEGRWSAVVLVKACIEAGGLETLSKSNTWVRNLLGILKKPDPSSTRSLAVITLTRIFMLTWDYPALVREITTPALPTFVNTCLANAGNVRCSHSELQTILQSFATLLPHHPTIFRSSEAQVRSLLTRIISSSTSSNNVYYTAEHVVSAQRVIALLPYCSPKQGGAEKWDDIFQSTIKAAHQTCDRVFRSVIEDWRSKFGIEPSLSGHQLTSGEVELEGEDSSGLTGWRGIFTGAERLRTLLRSLTALLTSSTPSTVLVRIGFIVDLLNRLFAITIPHPGKQEYIKPNPQISKEERDALFACLPDIHVEALEFLLTLSKRFTSVTVPVVASLIDQLIPVFKAEKFNVTLRSATYTFFTHHLKLAGVTLGKDEVSDLSSVGIFCCEDLLPPNDVEGQTSTADTGTAKKSKQQTGDLLLQMSKARPSHPPELKQLHESASALLTALLANLQPVYIPRKLRAQMDRTAILTRNKSAMLASVMNPAPSSTGNGLQASLLPFLARLYPGDPEVEALLRPRLPVIGNVSSNDETNDMHEDEMGDYDEGDVEEQENGYDTQTPDLLTVLDQHINTNAGESNGAGMQAPTVVPEIAEPTLPQMTTSHEDTAGKRLASDSVDTHGKAKRLRFDAAIEERSAQTDAELSRGETVLTQASLPSASGIDKTKPLDAGLSKSSRSSTISHPPANTLEETNTQLGDSDDGSDFELPPLTMERDTDEEDESE